LLSSLLQEHQICEKIPASEKLADKMLSSSPGPDCDRNLEAGVEVQDIGWCLTAKEPDMSFSYKWTIEEFRSKMENFKLGQQLESSQFVINGFKLCINLYPNGRNEEEGGFVSLFLRNDNSIQLEVKCEFVLGPKESFKHVFSFNRINPNSGYGFPKMYSHEQIISKEILESDKLVIKAVITFKGKVRNISHLTPEIDEEDEICETEKVGLDLFKGFERQEFCDFEISCGDRNIKCHKAVLAARSPVFRAMLLNEMEESSKQKVEPRNFDYNTMNLVLRFLYKGQIESGPLEKNADAIFKAADYYEIIDLKKICEKVLIRKISIGNMLELLVLADMYKAPELREATKSLIVANGRELVKQKGWKDKLKQCNHLVFEILEAVIAKSSN
jgi:hypothetical protein